MRTLLLSALLAAGAASAAPRPVLLAQATAPRPTGAAAQPTATPRDAPSSPPPVATPPGDAGAAAAGQPVADAPAQPPSEATQAPVGDAAAQPPAGDAAAQPPPADAAAAQPLPSAPVASDVPAATDAPTLRPPDPSQQVLVSGAPLANPNVAVHVMQKKRFRDAGKHELVLFPAAVQTNGKFTFHAGSAFSYVYHLKEHFAVHVTPQYNWYANESRFNREIIAKASEQAQAASALLLRWGVVGGVEVTPLYGKFAFYQGTLAQFSLVLNGGVGVGSTEVLLRPDTVQVDVDQTQTAVPGRTAETGRKILGQIGGGFRVQLGNRFAFRLEARDLVYTARVDQVNGCNRADVDALKAAREANAPFEGLNVRGSCQVGKFDGVQPDTNGKKNLRDDILLVDTLLESPTSDVLNNLGFYAGFSVLF